MRGIAFAAVVVFVCIWIGLIVRLVGAIFFASARRRVTAHPYLHGLWFLIALLITVAALFPVSSRPRDQPWARTMATMAMLETACKSYHTEYGSFPAGNNAAITSALRGANFRNI